MQLVIAIATEVVFALVALASSIFLFALDAELLFVLFIVFCDGFVLGRIAIGLVFLLAVVSVVSTKDGLIPFMRVRNDFSGLENEVSVRFRVSGRRRRCDRVSSLHAITPRLSLSFDRRLRSTPLCSPLGCNSTT